LGGALDEGSEHRTILLDDVAIDVAHNESSSLFVSFVLGLLGKGSSLLLQSIFVSALDGSVARLGW